MPKGTIEKADGVRAPFEFTDYGNVDGKYVSSFKIGDGPIVESAIALDCTAEARLTQDNYEIVKAGGRPWTLEFD